MFTERQSSLLQAVIQAYTPQGEPVASERIVRQFHIRCSPATVRNDMVSLEESGYLVQPHTSAGRVPTEKAYRWFVQDVLPERQPTQVEQNRIESAVTEQGDLSNILQLLADMCERAVLFSPENSSAVFAGIRNLLAQKELHDGGMLEHIGAALDNANILARYFAEPAAGDVGFAIGADNPFDSHCASVYSTVSINGLVGTVVILSPLRMDYGACVGYLRFLKTISS